jgi:hypothetical protein
MHSLSLDDNIRYPDAYTEKKLANATTYLITLPQMIQPFILHTAHPYNAKAMKKNIYSFNNTSNEYKMSLVFVGLYYFPWLMIKPIPRPALPTAQ